VYQYIFMPVLNWIGKEAVINHDKEVPFKLLKKIKSASVGENSQNLIIHGDNLEALKALMPHYQGKVKCIYIDPPYNTGNEGWVYNDRVNSPKIRQWLGKVVGKESEDLTRHDKWLCMMYPRLKLLRDLLANDGVIFVSIDDNEHCNLRGAMDEIFTEGFVTSLHVQMSTVQGQKVRSAKQGNVVKNAEYILIYSKNGKKNIGIKPLYDVSAYDSHYSLFLEENGNEYKIKNLSNVVLSNEKILEQLRYFGLIKNGKKPSISGENIAKAYSLSTMFRDFVHENAHKIARYHDTVEIEEIRLNKKTKIVRESAVKYSSQNREYIITKDSKGSYKQLITLNEKVRVADDFYKTFGVTTIRGDWWPGFYLDMGNVSKEGHTEYKSGKKPVRLISQLVKFVAGEDSIILDSFAGSGTTAHAVLDLNKEDGGNRKFILVEMEDHVAKDITAERVKRAIKANGYNDGFEYCELDKPLFDEDGQIEKTCDFKQFATYIYFTETQTNIDPKKIKDNYIGGTETTDYFLIYKEKNANDLTKSFVNKLPKDSKQKVVYADRCLADDASLASKNVIFKQIPYEVIVY
jgi:adenine-specific DNA-methyltransferase